MSTIDDNFTDNPRTFSEAVAYAVALLASNFNKTTSEPMFIGYMHGLKGLSVKQIVEATGIALQRSKFFPAASELRSFANTGETPIADRAVLAWSIVFRAISREGGYRSVDFDDPVINATIHQLGGWPKLCDTPIAEFPFRQKDFERLYSALVGHGSISAELARPLHGLIEVDNAGKGLESPNPVQRIETGLPPLPIAKRIAAAAARPKPKPPAIIETTGKAIGLPPPKQPSQPPAKPPTKIPGLEELTGKQRQIRRRLGLPEPKPEPKPKDKPDEAAA